MHSSLFLLQPPPRIPWRASQPAQPPPPPSPPAKPQPRAPSQGSTTPSPELPEPPGLELHARVEDPGGKPPPRGKASRCGAVHGEPRGACVHACVQSRQGRCRAGGCAPKSRTHGAVASPCRAVPCRRVGTGRPMPPAHPRTYSGGGGGWALRAHLPTYLPARRRRRAPRPPALAPAAAPKHGRPAPRPHPAPPTPPPPRRVTSGVGRARAGNRNRGRGPAPRGSRGERGGAVGGSHPLRAHSETCGRSVHPIFCK